MTMQQAPRSNVPRSNVPRSNVQGAKPFTGRHMAAILVAGFGVVIGVNVTMASLASSTFGGVVVENSYVASQHFNRWLDEAAKEKTLGWTIEARRAPDGRVAARGAQVPHGATVTAVARHPLGRLPDAALTFREDANGTWLSDKALPAGRWMLRFTVEAGGRTWRTEQPLEAGASS